MIHWSYSQGFAFLMAFSFCSCVPWKALGQKPMVIFDEHGDEICSMVISPDSEYVATGAKDRTVRIWRAETGELTHSLEHPLQERWGRVTSVAFSPDGSILASAGIGASSAENDGVYLWDTESGERLKLYSHRSPYAVSFSPDGGCLVCGSGGGATAVFWDLRSGEQVDCIEFDGAEVDQLAFSPDGKRLLVAYTHLSGYPLGTTELRRAVLLSLPDKEILASYEEPHSQGGAPIAYSPEGSWYAMYADYHPRTGMYVYEADTRREHCVINRGSEPEGVAFSPDGTKLLVGRALYDVETRQILVTFPLHRSTQPIAYSPDGTKVILAYSSSAYVYDVSSFNTGVDNWARWDE